MTIQVGTIVEVTKAYKGNGQYAADGVEGFYTVVGALPPGKYSGTMDYYLVRGDVRHDPKKSEWDVIVNESRIKACNPK